MDLPHIEIVIGLDMVETQVFSHRNAGAIYFSDKSCWWSHHRGHALAGGPTMKCPLGGQIFMEKDWEAWLAAAKENPGYYGRHGLAALVAAHHANCRDSKGGGLYAAADWEPYNLALDKLAEETAGLKKTAVARA